VCFLFFANLARLLTYFLKNAENFRNGLEDTIDNNLVKEAI